MDEGIDLKFCISTYNPTTQLCMNIHQKNFNKICWAIMSRCLSSTNSTFHNGLRFLHQKPNHWTNLESGIGNVTVGEGHQCCQGLSMTIIPGLEHLNRTWSTFPTKQCCGAGSILTGSGLFSAGSSSYKKWPFNHTFFLQHPTFLTRKKSFIFKNLYNLLLKVSSFEKNKYNNCKYSDPPVEGGSTAGGECYCQRDQLFPPHTFLVNPASTETVMPRAILVLSLGIPSENPQAWFRVTPTRMAVPRY